MKKIKLMVIKNFKIWENKRWKRYLYGHIIEDELAYEIIKKLQIGKLDPKKYLQKYKE